MERREFAIEVPGGVIVGHEYSGTGPDIMLVPSVGFSEDTWTKTAMLLARYFRVVTLDLRGHGQSTCEVGDTPEELLRDFGRVADSLGLEQPILAGYMLGGSLAVVAALMEPERFGGVCLIDSPSTDTDQHLRSLLDLLSGNDMMETLTWRFGLGTTGRGEASFSAFVDRMARVWIGDWENPGSEKPQLEQVRYLAERATLRYPDGSWKRRPDPETIITIAGLTDRLGVFPGRTMLRELTVPVGVIQPTNGDYGSGVAEFAVDTIGDPSVRVTWMPGGASIQHTHYRELAALMTQQFRDLVTARESTALAV